MKIAIIGDLHIGARNNSDTFLKYMKEYFDTEFFPYLKEHNIKHVIQLGDTLDKRKSIDFVTSGFLIKNWLNKFDENDIQLYSIIGNHDTYFKNTNEISGIKQYETLFQNVHIIDKCTPIKFGTTVFHCIPWLCEENKNEILEYIENVKSDDINVACGHFDLAGFNVNKSCVSFSGTLDKTLLENTFDLTLSGHYHTPSEQGTIKYIGTPYQITWNDYGDKKKFIVYDTDSNSPIETIEEVYTQKSLFHKIVYQSGQDVSSVDLPQKSFVKVLITEPSELLDVFINELNEKFNLSQCQIIDMSNSTDEPNEDEMKNLEIDDPFHILMNAIKDYNDSYLTNELLSIYKEAQSITEN